MPVFWLVLVCEASLLGVASSMPVSLPAVSGGVWQDWPEMIYQARV